MRKLLFLFLFIPSFVNAQINRSAGELARENIQEYLTKKLFKQQPYKPVSFSDLRVYGETKSDIEWTIDHKFEITEKGKDAFQHSVNVQKLYKFIFYLDDKMKVLRAESYLVL